MKISEKIALASNPKTLVLHKEGLFYKAYNQNAMFFVQKIKSYKVSVKHIKSVNQLVYSIGFPSEALVSNELLIQNILNISRFEDETNNTIIFSSQVEIKNQEQYTAWTKKAQQDFVAPSIQLLGKATNNQSYTDLVECIKSFELINSTPMQAMNFIQELQHKIPHKK